jgi:hypothetical protein
MAPRSTPINPSRDPPTDMNQDDLPVESILSNLGAVLANLGVHPSLAETVKILDPQEITKIHNEDL